MDEARRIQILRRYSILDTPPEEVFDRITWLAARHFGTPIALVSFIDETRQWFKSVLGLEMRETGRDISFCNVTLAQDDVVVVPDTQADPRFATSQLVTAPPGLRFYAGAPLITSDDARLGTVAVIDTRPRPDFRAEDRQFLRHLARIAIHELEMRQAASDVQADIERHKKVEALLRENSESRRLALQAAERANQAKTKFFAAASHDLRQPFQSMRLLTYLLESTLTEERHRHILGKLSEALGAGEALLNALLDVSTLEAGTLRPRPADIALRPMLARLAAEYQAAAAAKGLRVRLSGDEHWTRSDPVLLERMVRNLLANAVAYTRSGGVLLGCRPRRGGLAVEVWDTGVGIPENQHESIFEDFVQLGNPERNQAHGLGLGLAVVRRMSALLGHRVELCSRLDKGSVFRIHLPAAPRPAAAPEEAAGADEAALHGTRVLIVEDDPLQGAHLAEVLAGWGCEAVLAEDGADAEAKARGMDRRPDVLLTDYRLRRGLTGLDAIERLRDALHQPIPAVVLTGDTDPERLREVQAAGYHMLHKPYSPGALRKVLAEALGNKTRSAG